MSFGVEAWCVLAAFYIAICAMALYEKSRADRYEWALREVIVTSTMAQIPPITLNDLHVIRGIAEAAVKEK